jgi:hypothetical protein
MATRVHVKGMSEFTSLLKKAPDAINRSTDSIVRQEARALCISLGSAAQPLGLQEGGRVTANREKVARDINQVYLTTSNTAAVAYEIKRRSQSLAQAYLRAIRENNQAQARRYMRDAGISIGSFDPKKHRAARTGAYGEVESTGARDVVQKNQLRAYIRKKQGTVGFAKAAWYAAAKAIGGRVRRNLVAGDGKRTTVEIFPAYLKKIARAHPGIGSARVGYQRVEIINNVRHAQDAYVPEYFYDDAVYNGQLSFQRALEKSISQLRRRGFRLVES